MAIGEDDSSVLIDDEAGSIAGSSGFSVERSAGGGSKHNHGGNHLVKGLPPVLGRGSVLPEGSDSVDLHAEVATAPLLHGGVQSNSLRS